MSEVGKKSSASGLGWRERRGERQRQSVGALLVSILVGFWECYAEFDVRTATTLSEP
jgi:hypothetical protein